MQLRSYPPSLISITAYQYLKLTFQTGLSTPLECTPLSLRPRLRPMRTSTRLWAGAVLSTRFTFREPSSALSLYVLWVEGFGALAHPQSDILGPKYTMITGLLCQAIFGFALSGAYNQLVKQIAGFAVMYGIFIGKCSATGDFLASQI